MRNLYRYKEEVVVETVSEPDTERRGVGAVQVDFSLPIARKRPVSTFAFKPLAVRNRFQPLNLSSEKLVSNLLSKVATCTATAGLNKPNLAGLPSHIAEQLRAQRQRHPRRR
jgi:hypothetical protein